MGVNKNLTDPAYNSSNWNVPLNANFDNIDQGFGGTQVFNLSAYAGGTIAVSSGTFVGAYPANTASYVPLVFYIASAPTGATILQIPSGVAGRWLINIPVSLANITITISSAGGGTSVACGTGITDVYSDGTNIALTAVNVVAMNDNRIINGDMLIDQRNNGASGTAINVYTIDRWVYSASQAAKGTWGQIPQGGAFIGGFGFGYALSFTSSSSYGLTATDNFSFSQRIESNLITDFMWGTAFAQPVTLSFVAISSLTGTFGGSIRNAAVTRSYPFSYSLVANTWTKITITIPGDTTGTWVLTGTAEALSVLFSLGTGTTFSGTPGAWAGTNYVSATGATSVVGVNGATFQLSGVKLETGTVATPFPRESLTKQLEDCRRYYQGKVASLNILSPSFFSGVSYPISPIMRTTPTIVFTDAIGNVSRASVYNGSSFNNIPISAGGISATPNVFTINVIWGAPAGSIWANILYKLDAEL